MLNSVHCTVHMLVGSKLYCTYAGRIKQLRWFFRNTCSAKYSVYFLEKSSPQVGKINDFWAKYIYFEVKSIKMNEKNMLFIFFPNHQTSFVLKNIHPWAVKRANHSYFNIISPVIQPCMFLIDPCPPNTASLLKYCRTNSKQNLL